MPLTQVPLNMLDPAAGSLMFRNRIINGACMIAQRGAVAAANNTLVYGGCDRIGIAPVSFSTASGTIQQQNAGFGSMGYSQAITGMTTTGSGVIQFVQRIEQRNTIDLNSNSVTISAKVYQNTGSALNISLQLNKASAADNFATNTQIAVSGNISVPSGTLTSVSFTTALGSADASNGLQAMINFNVGAVTSKDFHVTDWQLEKGSVATPFEIRPYGMELALCQRYFVAGTALGQYVCTVSVSYGIPEWLPVLMRAVPSVTNGTIATNIGSTGFSLTAYANKIVWVLTANATGAGNVSFTYTASAEL